jgi:N-methylhydantoinase B
VPAQGYNCTTALYFTQQRKDGTFRVLADILGGGYGGCHDYDGADGVDCILSNCSNTPIESIEQVHPHLLLKSYGLLPDTGGPGEWRGGLGFRREVEIVEEGVFFNLYTDHFKFAPGGVHEGQSGAKGKLSVLRGDDIVDLGPNTHFDCQVGDIVRLSVGGGGGFGDPKKRPREAVERDIEDGRITMTHAQKMYGYADAAAE